MDRQQMTAQEEQQPRKWYTVTEFCAAYPVSRSELYKLWKRKKGPRHKRIGLRKYIIPVEAAEEWWKSVDVEKEEDAA